MDTAIYTTPALKVGKYKWRIIVFEMSDALVNWQTGERGPERYTRYQYLDGVWRSETSHPHYDSNDGMWGGLPKRLKKIYDAHEPEIRIALNRGA